MYIPKRYGQSKIDKCPFCNKQATAKNKQALAVCSAHITSSVDNMKCACGSFLELRSGKFGAYFNCMNCGNVNFKKAAEMNSGHFAVTQKAAQNNQIANNQTVNNQIVREQKAQAKASVESIIRTGATFKKPFISKLISKEPSRTTFTLNKKDKKPGVTIIHPDDPDYYEWIS